MSTLSTVFAHRTSDKVIKQQHRMLSALLTAIESRLASHESVNRSLVSMLNSLATHLKSHFEFEESEEYFSEIVRSAPRLSSEIGRLKDEHSSLLEEVDAMIDQAAAAFAEHRDLPVLAEQFKQFLDRFEDHEHAEKRLVQEVYSLDLGTND